MENLTLTDLTESVFQVVYFVNDREIDLEAALTMGVNAKLEENNPIGFFGTGLKYAIAVLLRSGHQITIASGTNLSAFTTEKKETRGTEYELVLHKGEKTGFTTSLGKNWEIWMAYRELFCNAQDEGGYVSLIPVEPKEGQTVIAVLGFECFNVHLNRSKYFLETTPILVTENCEVHIPATEEGGAIYYKGVQVSKTSEGRTYNYNILSKLSLTEDRTLAAEYEAYKIIGETIALTEDLSIIQNTVLNKGTNEQHRCMWDYIPKVSTVFAAALESCREQLPYDLSNLRRSKCLKKPENKPKVNLSKEETDLVSEALKTLSLIGFDIESEIVISDDLGENVKGKAHDGKIYLSSITLAEGLIKTASVILEEEFHITRGLTDCTYSMQTYLFDLLITNSLSILNRKD